MDRIAMMMNTRMEWIKMSASPRASPTVWLTNRLIATRLSDCPMLRLSLSVKNITRNLFAVMVLMILKRRRMVRRRKSVVDVLLRTAWSLKQSGRPLCRNKVIVGLVIENKTDSGVWTF